VVFWQAAVDGLDPGGTYEYRLQVAGNARRLQGEPQVLTSKSPGEPVPATLGGTHVGTGGAVLNGTVGGTTLPTTYFFEYGHRPDDLNRKTPAQALPPPRNGRIEEIVSHDLHHFIPYTLETRFTGVMAASHPGSGPSPAGDPPPDLALTITTPFGKDRHHLSGIGVGDLVLIWQSDIENAEGQTGAYPGRTVDLRDAEVELMLRCHGLDPRGFYFSPCCQTYLGTACTDYMEDTANWCLTGQMTDMSDLNDGNWHAVRYTYRCDSEIWTYAGNNPEEEGGRANRYAYGPLGDALMNHRGNLAFWFVLGDERDTCEGELEVYSASLRYRDDSLLSLGWGARLVRWPAGAVSDPVRLTSGWRGNPDHFWTSGPNPRTPQEFVWDFGEGVDISAVRVHQNTLHPAKRLMVSGCVDGKTFEPIADMVLPQTRELEAADRRTLAVLDRPANLRYMKVSILSGYQSEFWGLDAVEVFGDGGPPSPEVAASSVSEEVQGLSPGETIYYRLTAGNQAGTTTGEIHSLKLPSDCRPMIHWVRVLKIENRRATLLVRLAPMGRKTQLRGRFTNGDGKAIDGPVLAAGSQPVPRHMTYVVSCPGESDHWKGHLRAVNDMGESDAMEINWEIDGELEKHTDCQS